MGYEVQRHCLSKPSRCAAEAFNHTNTGEHTLAQTQIYTAVYTLQSHNATRFNAAAAQIGHLKPGRCILTLLSNFQWVKLKFYEYDRIRKHHWKKCKRAVSAAAFIHNSRPENNNIYRMVLQQCWPYPYSICCRYSLSPCSLFFWFQMPCDICASINKRPKHAVVHNKYWSRASFKFFSPARMHSYLLRRHCPLQASTEHSCCFCTLDICIEETMLSQNCSGFSWLHTALFLTLTYHSYII